MKELCSFCVRVDALNSDRMVLNVLSQWVNGNAPFPSDWEVGGLKPALADLSQTAGWAKLWWLLYMNGPCYLHSNHTPHARHPLVVVDLPPTRVPSTGASARLKFGICICSPANYSQLCVYNAASSLRDCVLTVVDIPPVFRAPFELRRICKVSYLGSYALEIFIPCIRKTSYPESIGFIWISPALRILSIVLFNGVGHDDFILCAVSFASRTPAHSKKPVLLWVVRHQLLERTLLRSHVRQDQVTWGMPPSA